jgi:hypothetical protein
LLKDPHKNWQGLTGIFTRGLCQRNLLLLCLICLFALAPLLPAHALSQSKSLKQQALSLNGISTKGLLKE